MIRSALLLVCVGACTGAATKVVVPPRMAIDAAAHLATISEDIELTAGGDSVPGTLVRPGEPGVFPAIVIFAGSGPTDRDWTSPLIAAKNGSGKLLAEALAAHGAVVIRFDKASSGKNHTSVLGKSIDLYVDEMRGALAYLRTRPEVDPARLYIAGHSEGGLHTLRTALVEGAHVKGVLLLSTPGRTLRDVVIGQLRSQIETKAPGQTETLLAPFRAALDDFLAGHEIDPVKATPIPGLQTLLRTLTSPSTAVLSRALLSFDPATAIAQVTQPVLIFNGMRDVQVDPELDAKVLHAAAKGSTLVLAPEADHVLKHETKSLAELRADLGAVELGYNSPDRGLDETTVSAIVGWLATH